MEDTDSQRTNRLIHETSPYLLQHAHNPVDWHPWGEEALKKARELDRPILLSVGYSACHWCHVMERESFEDEEIAELMNRLFINIKVDREERPDVDSLYMNYVQMTTGSGGWPLTVFLTPDMVPFYGGTYFPPRDNFGRPGFPRVLQQVAEAYQKRRDELEKMRPEIISQLTQAVRFETPEAAVNAGVLEEAAAALARQYDSRFGGFGAAPKFPAAMPLGFLLRHYLRSGSQASIDMVSHSLRSMARGGMYDQLGGGFHRYSVDERWLVPHFEKMLYDNALLARIYLETFQVTEDPECRRVAEETLEYVRRDLTDPSGGFYSAEDADSEGEEGKFYVWDRSQVLEALGQDGELFCEFYDVTESGNFEGHNILNIAQSPEEFAQRQDLSLQELQRRLDAGRKHLLEVRSQRIRPARDDKVLASWNGWMLSAFALGGWVLDRDDLLDTARSNAEFLASEMIQDGRLHRTWKEGQARLAGYLEDYAAVAEGFLDLFEATGEVRWFESSQRLVDRMLKDFWDPERGDFYFTAEDQQDLLIRQKEHMDNATPSGNSNACSLLLRLSRFTGNQQHRTIADKMLQQMALAASQHPQAFGNWLQCIDFALGPELEVVVLGGEADRQPLLQVLRRRFLPSLTLLQAAGSVEGVELLEGKAFPKSRAVAYICRDATCGPAAATPEELESQLAGR